MAEFQQSTLSRNCKKVDFALAGRNNVGRKCKSSRIAVASHY
ncbi:hypothetical protein BLLJ_0176 [Bifidobacterium longum subsp. longum JCM 1217]|uniref:Uncharacterized protein n=1 Tax=Bifidobacterium longum subsp. longum 2-2B TaxID=1161745 RepID=A0AAV3FK12_BIFLL|nr:hypothetical protein HMPREF1315_1949 [Bifidobacterium longum subsp. longum 2-2B]EIJ27062.1 hypothetical protein HMPREF1314_2038 [Bifidobacterium longum subsp. longum 35B]BAJ65846.1 hypothetical protein BLLJ_0176 [Bifidobacterium longum subsp. longum JCM 1217]